MSKENFKLIITMDQENEALRCVWTSLKAKQADLQYRIDTEMKYRTDMAMSVSCAGMAAIIRLIEQMGGHPREYLMAQVNTIIDYYLDHPGFTIGPDEFTKLN
jgi:hypothetical protein